MTHKEILEKAIQKAIDGGWTYYVNKFDIATEPSVVLADDRFNQWYILFVDHDFAEALWGTGRISRTASQWQEVERTPYSGQEWALPLYMWHLQHMVIADDPLTYLKEHI